MRGARAKLVVETASSAGECEGGGGHRFATCTNSDNAAAPLWFGWADGRKRVLMREANRDEYEAYRTVQDVAVFPASKAHLKDRKEAESVA